MILKAFDNDCGIISVDTLEDIYKVAESGVDETIYSYIIEKEGDLLTVTYKLANDREIKFALVGDDVEIDLGLSSKPSSYTYLGGHTKLDQVFNEGGNAPIVKTKDDGSIVLKGSDEKSYAIPQKFIDIYFNPSSEQSRYEKIVDEKAKQLLEQESLEEPSYEYDDNEFGMEEELY